MLTSPWFIKLRRLTRRLGLNKFAISVISNSRYEDRFGTAFKEQIRRGDTVWDIGANLGHYTSVFFESTGITGRVVAFEPTTECFVHLSKLFSSTEQVILKNIAVGHVDGAIEMVLEADPLATTHRIAVGQESLEDELVVVDIRSAASLVDSEPELFPNIVKIDVEGHEGAVFDGFIPLLSDCRLRCVGIEMHFGLLDDRGESGRPKQIEETLLLNGFEVRWTDPSHLLAIRRDSCE